MNCEEVKAHLTEYLDKTLDTPTTTRVATHLISCAPCGAEASDLADCLHQVAALPALDPPLGFAQRVMAHVREIEAKPTLWQRWFLPWSKTIPLQATALVMVGIIGVFLYQKDEQLKQTDPSKTAALSASLESDKAQIESNPAVSFRTDRKEKLAVKAPAQAAKRVERERETIAATLSEQIQAAKTDGEARSEENKAPTRPPIPVQGVTAAREPSPVFGDPRGFSAPMPPLGGVRQAPPRSAPMVLERAIPLGERVADYEFVVRRRPPQRRDHVESLSADALKKSTDEDTASGLAARPAAPPSTAPKIESIAEIRFYNVAPEHFEFFKKELASEAIIEAESKAAAAKEKEIARFDRQLLIKVTILPPALPEPTAPPR